MKKLLGIALAMFTVFAVNAQSIFDCKTSQELQKHKKEKIDTITNENAKKDRILNYIFMKNLLNKDVSKMSFDEFEKTAFDNYDNEKINKLAQIVLFIKPYKKFQKDLINKHDNSTFVINVYPIYADKKLYGTVQNYNKALMPSVKYSSLQNNYKNVQKLLTKLNSIQDELKTDEIKESLKYMKRYVYPKITEGDEWKQLATKIELQLKSLE